MAFVSKIISTVAMVDGWQIVTESDTVHMSDDWFCKLKPVIGDYLTHCTDGYYSVCYKHAYNAIMQELKYVHHTTSDTPVR